jgi:leucyl-tRNA synthetase
LWRSARRVTLSSVNKPYEASPVESKWQQRWADAQLYHTDLKKAKKPFYSLVMFPYPSGDKLHVGHWYNYAPADSYARFKRLQGYDVFSPMGYDAFGLPAENYAIKTGIHPMQSIGENTQTMTKQLSRIGCMYDWNRTVNTSTPEYYRWTQWVFLQMLKHGLAYKKDGNVNWCPKDQTVLANEQAQDGVCDRCGTAVVQKPMTQWYWKITEYADRLLNGLEDLEWPEKTKLMQRNWIGKSEGAEVVFPVEASADAVTVFTTRVDTIYSAAFVVLAPEHPLVEKITTKEQHKHVEHYRSEARKKTDLQRTDLAGEKTGVFTGAYVINPVNEERLPIWIGDFVLAHYGHGAVFGDAHDERDFVFAKKYDIPLKTTIKPADGKNEDAIQNLEICFSDDGILYDSDKFSGLTSAEARKKITAWLESLESGRRVVQYRLRDWSISRQRYWGAPIPVVYDPEGNPHPVPDEHLPWLLPTDVEFKPTGTAPLAQSKELVERTEKIFGKGWKPEVDTMDTFVCSSFYYLRYLAGDDLQHVIDPTTEKHWMPVSMYIGGAEHACMHLIYARFVMMALHDFGFVKHDEPFKKLVHQGTITNQGAKMSKSKGNVVSPDAFVEHHGSDVFRMYLMFMGPFTQGGDWSDTGIKGIDRFVQRIYKLCTTSVDAKAATSSAVTTKLHATIKKCTEDIERLHFNTVISALMELLNTLEGEGSVHPDVAKTLVVLLAPIAPHLSDELWEALGGKGFVLEQRWPAFDPALLVAESVVIAVQVNGKLRGQVTVPAEASQEDVYAAALEEENVAKFIDGNEPKKVIYVRGRLLNIVV